MDKEPKLAEHTFNPETGKIEERLLIDPYEGTFHYAASQLDESMRELGRVLLAEFVKYVFNPIFPFLRVIAEWFYPVETESPQAFPLREFVKTADGIILLVEDAPAMEVWRDGLRFDENGVCIRSEH